MMKLKNYAKNHRKKNINNFVLIDPKKREQGRYCICNESKKLYKKCTPETKPF